jgi:hypothetical protein
MSSFVKLPSRLGGTTPLAGTPVLYIRYIIIVSSFPFVSFHIITDNIPNLSKCHVVISMSKFAKFSYQHQEYLNCIHMSYHIFKFSYRHLYYHNCIHISHPIFMIHINTNTVPLYPQSYHIFKYSYQHQ